MGACVHAPHLHARTHARPHARTHAHTHAKVFPKSRCCVSALVGGPTLSPITPLTRAPLAGFQPTATSLAVSSSVALSANIDSINDASAFRTSFQSDMLTILAGTGAQAVLVSRFVAGNTSKHVCMCTYGYTRADTHAQARI